MKHVAIYSRKSVYSDKSDSTKVQLDLGVDYCKTHFLDQDYEIYKYEDEGYTGANTNRPEFNRLVQDVKDNKIDVLICYKIDRVSRNIADFAHIFDLLTEHNVSFISIKEQIDTETPVGRAMMYICTVFAQMERETIAERVSDNMLELAKSGKWAGGKAPIGYKLQRIEVGGKQHTTLVPDSNMLPYFHMVFDAFLNGSYSLNGLQTYFKNNKIKTPTGKFLSTTQLYTLLKNPHYAAADADTLNYFKKLGCTIGCDESKFDGEFGLIVYRRTCGGKKKKHTLNPPEKWIVSVGIHKPLVSSKDWLTVQSKFGNNTFSKERKNKIGILKGTVRCRCGYLMRTHRKHDAQYNRDYDYYFCQQRMRKGKEYCDLNFVHADQLDNAVIELLKSIAIDKSTIDNYRYDDTCIHALVRSRSDVQKDINMVNTKIDNLTNALSNNSSSTAAKFIISQLEQLDKQLTGYKFELLEVEIAENKQKEQDILLDDKYETICNIVANLENLDYDEINGLIHNLFKECVWDGTQLRVKL